MPISDSVHPWKKGFKPVAAFCPKCMGGDVYYTGDVTDSEKHHIYACLRCGSQFAAPTFYATCNFDNSTLEKDHFYTPCIHGRCGRMVPIALGNPRCVHFRPAQSGDLDDKFKRALRQRSVRAKREEKQPEQIRVGSGVDTELEKARQERLRKLREEK